MARRRAVGWLAWVAVGAALGAAGASRADAGPRAEGGSAPAAGEAQRERGPDPCLGERCSGHGVCMAERREPLCLCDEGYAAEGTRCERARAVGASGLRAQQSTGGTVVHVALAEGQRGPREVGRTLVREPYALARYVEPGQMWCSDFVSWVYRVAGVPFTGGYRGGWLLTNNLAIRRWFQRRGLWVDHDSPGWARFSPRPGDFVRLHTRSGHGHSGIVRYATATTLHTVEGNVGNRVRLRRYHRFRRHRKIDGFGILTRPQARRATLAAAR